MRDLTIYCFKRIQRKQAFSFALWVHKRAIRSWEKVIHIGDNIVSDNRSARKCDIEPVWYKGVNPRGNAHRAFDMTSLIGSHTVELSTQNCKTVISSIRSLQIRLHLCRLSCTRILQIHNDYCKNHGIDKILFLSRDGYILKSVYDRLYPDSNTEYVSGHALPQQSLP